MINAVSFLMKFYFENAKRIDNFDIISSKVTNNMSGNLRGVMQSRSKFEVSSKYINSK